MKILFKYLTVTILFISSMFYAGCEKEVIINEDELPAQAALFMSTHFSTETIVTTVMDKEGGSTTFEVTLANGVNIDFDKNGKCISMDGHGQSLPQSALHSQIWEYTQSNYSGHFITDWGIEAFGQKVELSNGVELGFDINGGFIRIL